MHPTTTRRDFLALGAAPFLPAAARQTPGAQARFGGLPLGLQSYSLRAFPFDRMLELVAELGLHQIETFPAHLPERMTPETCEQVKKKVRVKEIAIHAHGVVAFGKELERNRKLFEFANRMGIRNLTCDPDPESLDGIDQLVAEFGIRAAVHNHGPTHRYGSIAQLRKLLDGRHKWFGACIDTGHMIRSGEDPVKAIRELGPRVFGLHLKDFDQPRGDAKGVVLGKGQLDVAAVWKALRAVGFPADGSVSLEYEENAEDPMADLRACVAAAEAGARKAG
jgi:inosose dehydratase